MASPGLIVLFGSGETSDHGRRVFDQILSALPPAARLALLETPAGFELNSDRVIGRVGEFFRLRLQNYAPRVTAVAARQRGTPFSPDDPAIVAPLLQADLIFMGPGSPSYAVRQLRHSLAWHYLLARHRLGAVIALASAATIAVSAYALPVYEIYKVGEDLHWKAGLDLFGMYGLPLVFIPHWNNNDGGDELDTSRCFMGQKRFVRLMSLLPPNLTVIGLDEKTALVMDFTARVGRVIGLGGVTLIHTGPAHDPPKLEGTELEEVAQQRHSHVHIFRDGESFALQRIGDFHIPSGGDGLPEQVWQAAQAAHNQAEAGEKVEETPPAAVQALLEQRRLARQRKDWVAADALRHEIAAQGWEVADTPTGQVLRRKQAV